MRNALFLVLVSACWALPSRAAAPEAVKEIARELVCLCGDCNRESLATCLCSFATSQRQRLEADLDADLTRQVIIAQFVDRFGPVVLATPPREGYNLLARVVPSVLLILGIGAVRTVLVSWRRSRTAALIRPGSGRSAVARIPEHEARLRQELDNFDVD